MTGVLAVLAVGAVVGGVLGVPEGLTKSVGLSGDYNWFAQQLKPVVMARGVVAAAPAHHDTAAETHATDARSTLVTDPPAGATGAPLRVAKPGGEQLAWRRSGGASPAGGSPADVSPVLATDPPIVREGLKRHPGQLEEIGLVLLAVAVFGAGAAFAGWGFPRFHHRLPRPEVRRAPRPDRHSRPRASRAPSRLA